MSSEALELAKLIREATSGARIFVGTSSLIALGKRAAARICPEKQIDFLLRHDALDVTENEMSKESHCNE